MFVSEQALRSRRDTDSETAVVTVIICSNSGGHGQTQIQWEDIVVVSVARSLLLCVGVGQHQMEMNLKGSCEGDFDIRTAVICVSSSRTTGFNLRQESVFSCNSFSLKWQFHLDNNRNAWVKMLSCKSLTGVVFHFRVEWAPHCVILPSLHHLEGWSSPGLWAAAWQCTQCRSWSHFWQVHWWRQKKSSML